MPSARCLPLLALPLLAACDLPPPAITRSVPASQFAPGKPDVTVLMSDRQPSERGRSERFAGQFDGGRITITLTPLPNGQAQVIATSPRQPPCTQNWRAVGTWSGDTLQLPFGVSFVQRGRLLEMWETDGTGRHCSLSGTLRPV